MTFKSGRIRVSRRWAPSASATVGFTGTPGNGPKKVSSRVRAWVGVVDIVVLVFCGGLFSSVLCGGAALQVLGERIQQLFGGGGDNEFVQVAFVE